MIFLFYFVVSLITATEWLLNLIMFKLFGWPAMMGYDTLVTLALLNGVGSVWCVAMRPHLKKAMDSKK